MFPPSSPEVISAYLALAVSCISLLVGIWRVSWGAQSELAARDKKLLEIELWNRDNFVRRADFSDAIVSLRSDIQANAARFERKLDVIDEKLDKIKGH